MIHPSAYIDKDCIIEDNVQIGPMAYVGPGCVLHSGVVIGAKATVELNTEIGENTVLSPNAHVGGAPQDIGYKGEPTRLIIGKNNIIREFVTIHRATTKEDGVTVVGDNCYFMIASHIAHDCKIGNGVIVTNCATLAGHIHVDDFAVISGLVGVHQFTRIGKMAMISALSRVGKDVPPYCTVFNDSIQGLNVVGMRRHNISAANRSELKKALQIFTDKSLLLEDAKEELSKLNQTDEIVEFRHFIEKSKRGIIRNTGKEG